MRGFAKPIALTGFHEYDLLINQNSKRKEREKNKFEERCAGDHFLCSHQSINPVSLAKFFLSFIFFFRERMQLFLDVRHKFDKSGEI